MAASMNSGSEAVDLAIKISRKWGYNVKGIQPGDAKILTVTSNYHGKTLAPLSGSSNRDIKEGQFESLSPSQSEMWETDHPVYCRIRTLPPKHRPMRRWLSRQIQFVGRYQNGV